MSKISTVIVIHGDRRKIVDELDKVRERLAIDLGFYSSRTEEEFGSIGDNFDYSVFPEFEKINSIQDVVRHYQVENAKTK